jgi:hypothetical protein
MGTADPSDYYYTFLVDAPSVELEFGEGLSYLPNGFC